MEIIHTLKEKYQAKRQEEIQRQAEQIITLSDFNSALYISYANCPLLPVPHDWTSQQILDELNRLRQNYIHAKTYFQ